MEVVIQESMFHNLCWGCGPLNERGLRIKSYWNGLESVCSWQPQDVFMAGPRHILNGGIIATVLDCHCICTAIAVAYEQEGREMGPEPHIWYATASMNVRYLKPTPIDQPVLLRATAMLSGGYPIHFAVHYIMFSVHPASLREPMYRTIFHPLNG